MLAHGFYMPKSFCDQCQLEHEEFGNYCQGCERLVTSNLVSV
jgi:predicted amidophosphoribosyltransferase